MRFVAQYHDVHIVLLRFFADPRAWFAARGAEERNSRLSGSHRVAKVLSDAFGYDINNTAIADAMADLQSDRLLRDFNPHEPQSSDDDTLMPRITDRGGRFLRYLGAPS